MLAGEAIPVESDAKMLCLLDVLGFENLLHKVGLAQLHAKYEQMVQRLRETTGILDQIDLPDGPALASIYVDYAYFSDTLLFWTNYHPIKAQSFVRRMADLVCMGFELGLPLRGVFAAGEAVLDKNSSTYLGEPIVEAARAEREQRWIGVSFGPSLGQPEHHRFYPFLVQPYKSHYKNSTAASATGMTLDWPRHWRESRKTDPRVVIHSLNLEPEFSMYYEAAIRFVDYSEGNSEWFRRKAEVTYG